MSACCGDTAALAGPVRAHDVLERGLHTRRQPSLEVAGAWVGTCTGLRASFSLDCEGRRLKALRFQCTPCVTLVAYCQALAEAEQGRPLAEAPGLDGEALARLVMGVPPERQDRAVLAVAALRAALMQLPEESRA